MTDRDAAGGLRAGAVTKAEGAEGAAVVEAKRALRERAKGARAGYHAEDVERWSRALGAVLEREARWTAAGFVAGFLSLPGEPDLRSALGSALARGVVVWLPRVASSTTLEFMPVRGGAEMLTHGLVRSRFGIDEPAVGPGALSSFATRSEDGVNPSRLLVPLDVVLVPGLAFGRDGARLGYGRGYYDRVLAPLRALPQPRPLLLGVAFADVLWDAGVIPMAAHDVPVDAVLTQHGIEATSIG